MKEFTIGKNDAGQRLDRWLGKALPLLPAPLAQKYIRLKRVKLNGKGAKRDTRLVSGDVLQLYINDEFFDKPSLDNAFLSLYQPELNIVYEDENLLLVDKRPGMVVHPDDTEWRNTLITHIQAYLYQKKEWSPYWENSFAPALCNRIDRNTGGIVIAAKNAQTLRVLNNKIQARQLTKKYLCIAIGQLNPPFGRLEYFLRRDISKSTVDVFDHPVEGAKTALTLYHTLAVHDALSLVDVELLTGRTHQIRASFSHAGHPLLGDGKYGYGEVNRRYHQTRQALYSYYLRFDFPSDAEHLEYLRNRVFHVEDVPFVRQFFPNFCIDGIFC